MITLEKVLQDKVNAFVAKSEVDAVRISEKLENRVIDDWVVPSSDITFQNNGGLTLTVNDSREFHKWSLTDHSSYEIAKTIGVPPGWVKDAHHSGAFYEREAVAFALNKYMENNTKKDQRFLLRNVNEQVRGFLSTAYKRMNTRELFLAFIYMAQEMRIPLVGAYEGDARDYLEVLDPRLLYVDTKKNGLVAYARGAQLRNSDFGGGKLELRTYKLHATCLNGATGQSYLKEIHLGSRLGQEVRYSIETINKETEVRQLQIRDIFRHIFSDEVRGFEEAQILEAADEEVNLTNEIQRLPRLGVQKEEAKAVEATLLAHQEEDGLIGKQTRWLFSQAITAVSRELVPERKRELEAIGGGLVFNKPFAIN